MKIDPYPCVVSLKNGSYHTLFKFRDFLDLVDQEMDMGAAKWLETHVNQLEAAADYTTAFMDIHEETGAIMEILDSPRINRKKIAAAVENIRKTIKNQI